MHREILGAKCHSITPDLRPQPRALAAEVTKQASLMTLICYADIAAEIIPEMIAEINLSPETLWFGDCPKIIRNQRTSSRYKCCV